MDKPVSSSNSVEGEVYYPSTEVVAAAHAKGVRSVLQAVVRGPRGLRGGNEPRN
jgi:hypothetical protein